MFVVIYRFKVKDGMDEGFKKSWAELTKLIYQFENSRGSRIHFEGNNVYIAYAQWPDEKIWENSGENLPKFADEFRKRMKESCEEIKTLYKLEMIDDLLEEEEYSKK